MLLRDHIAALQITDAADREPRFWEQVKGLTPLLDPHERAGEAYALARAYGCGRRRVAVTRLLLRAAGEDRQSARMALHNAASRAVMIADDLLPPRPSVYRFGAAYSEPLALGARYIIRAGVGRCLVAEGPGADWCEANASGGPYCRRHDAKESAAAKARRDRCIRKTFDAAVPAILAGAALANALELAVCELAYQGNRDVGITQSSPEINPADDVASIEAALTEIRHMEAAADWEAAERRARWLSLRARVRQLAA